MAELTVRDLMSEQPFALRTDDDLTTVYDMMAEKHVRHVPVVDGDGELVGLVSHRDLVRRALAVGDELPVSNQRQLLRGMKIGEVMNSNVETTEPTASIVEAGQLMLDNKFGCLPVLEGGRLVGIITESDFVRYVVEQA